MFCFNELQADKIGEVELGPLTFPHPHPHPHPKPTLHYIPARKGEIGNNMAPRWRFVDRRTDATDLRPENNCLHF